MGLFSDANASISDQPLDLYLHGYISSRLMKLPSSDNTDEQGLPLCVSATSMEGIVMALSPFHHSLNYSSASIFGYATPVTEQEEKIFAMRLITNSLIPDRWENSRNPPFPAELQSTAILKVTVENASAKIRTGSATEDRKDEKDEEVRGKIWTGVVPTWIAAGEPIPAAANKVGVPAHVKDLVSEWNKGGNEKALSAAVETEKKKK